MEGGDAKVDTIRVVKEVDKTDDAIQVDWTRTSKCALGCLAQECIEGKGKG